MPLSKPRTKTGVNPEISWQCIPLDNANAGWTKGKWHTAIPPQARPYTRLSVVDYFGRKMVDNLSDEDEGGNHHRSRRRCQHRPLR